LGLRQPVGHSLFFRFRLGWLRFRVGLPFQGRRLELRQPIGYLSLLKVGLRLEWLGFHLGLPFRGCRSKFRQPVGRFLLFRCVKLRTLYVWFLGQGSPQVLKPVRNLRSILI
jgi:hypothetical protein